MRVASQHADSVHSLRCPIKYHVWYLPLCVISTSLSCKHSQSALLKFLLGSVSLTTAVARIMADYVTTSGHRMRLPKEAWRALHALDPADPKHVPSELKSRMTIRPPSKATPPTCLSDCTICFPQFRSLDQQLYFKNLYEEAINDETAQGKIDYLICDIGSNLEWIKKNVQQYGDALIKRWRRRTRDKRAALLTTALPDIYRSKWMPHTLLREVERTKGGLNAVQRYRTNWLLKWVDLPTLSEDPSCLLALLHHRSHSDPSEWVPFDCQELQFPVIHSMLRTSYNPHCVDVTPDSIGKLVQWSQDAVHRGDMIGFPMAKLIFESQHILSRFLRTVVELLLGTQVKDIPIASTEWYRTSPTAFRNPSSVLQSAYTNAAFSPPPRFDHRHVVELLSTRCKAAEDQLWQLQTSPALVRRMLRGLDRTINPNALTDKQTRFRAVYGMVWPFVQRCNLGMLLEHATWLLREYEGHERDFDRSQNLPKGYEAVLELFEWQLKDQYNEQLRETQDQLTLMEKFSKHFSFTPSKNVDGHLQPIRNTTPEDDWKNDPLFWSLAELGEHDHFGSLEPSFIFALIDDLIGSSLQQKDWESPMTQYLYDQISDMVAIHEALTSVRQHRPARRNILRPDQLGLDIRLPPNFDVRSSVDTWIANAAVQHVFDNHVDELYSRLNDILQIPAPSVKNTKEENKDWLARSYHALAEFWSEVTRLGVKYVLQDGKLSAMLDNDARGRFEWRMLAHIKAEFYEGFQQDATEIFAALEAKGRACDGVHLTLLDADAMPEAQEEQRREQRQSMSAMSGAEGARTGNHSTSFVQTFWGHENSTTSTTSAAKEKVKSRPPTTKELVEATTALSLEGVDKEPSEQVLVSVNADSKRLLTRMYVTDPNAKKNVRWESFVAAMVDAGFSATHSGGSAVTFKDERFGGGSIVFHRPHPDPCIDDVMLRGMGRRLSKWFGWDKNSFVVRGDCRSGAIEVLGSRAQSSLDP